MKSCFECGSTHKLQEHQALPSRLGTKHLITLCYSCHEYAHATRQTLCSDKTHAERLREITEELKLGMQRIKEGQQQRAITRSMAGLHIEALAGRIKGQQ